MGVCCGCVAQPASVQPRKTYNALVPALFEGSPPKAGAPLDAALRRKIQKLHEYAQRNPAKIPKVSRRLMRRIRAALRAPRADSLAHARVAAHALAHLLAMSAAEDSSYAPSFLAPEVVAGRDAVVPLLLRDSHIEMRALGAELLAAFAAVQTEADAGALEAAQALVPLTCRAARRALHAEEAGAAVARAAARGAVPNPIDLLQRRDPARVAALEAACLRALCEVVRLAARNRVAPRHLEQVQAVALDSLRRGKGGGGGGGGRGSGGTGGGGGGAGARGAARASSSSGASDAGGAGASGGGGGAAAATTAAGAPATDTAASTCGASASATAGAGATAEQQAQQTAAAAATTAGGVFDADFYSAMGAPPCMPAGGSVPELASRLLRLNVGFARDISALRDVMATLFRYMGARRGRWGDGAVVQVRGCLCAGGGWVMGGGRGWPPKDGESPALRPGLFSSPFW